MTQRDVFRVLLALSDASDPLREQLEDLRKDWEPEEPPPIVALGSLGTAIVGAADRVSDEELARIASIVESVLAGGSDEEKDGVATGFLESILTGADKPGVTRLIRKLGPLARQYCRDWDRFCGTRTDGLWDQ